MKNVVLHNLKTELQKANHPVDKIVILKITKKYSRPIIVTQKIHTAPGNSCSKKKIKSEKIRFLVIIFLTF